MAYPEIDINQVLLPEDVFRLYYPKLKIAFNFIPKNACSSIKNTLRFYSEGYASLDNVHNDSDYLKPFLLDSDWFVFLVVRDPFDRVVSAYLDKIINPIEENALKLVVQIYEERGLIYKKGKSVPFIYFLEWISTQPIDYLDAHWRPQSSLLRFSKYTDIFYMNKLESQWNSSKFGSVHPIVNVDLHSTSKSTHEFKDRDKLISVDGDFLYGYICTVNSFPNKNSFKTDQTLELVNLIYKDDYKFLSSIC
jgi:hypothetical protein